MFKLNDNWTTKGNEDLSLHQSLFNNQECEVMPGPRKKKKKKKHTNYFTSVANNCEEAVKGCDHINTPLQDTLEHEVHVEDASDLIAGKCSKNKCRKRKRKRDDVSGTQQSATVTHYGDEEAVTSSSHDSTQTDIQMKKSKLHSKMASKMEGAHFRWINEQLYNMPGDKAHELFQESPDLFQAYHKGFTTQVSKWPCNPLNRIISYVRCLPSNFIIADFGCGESELAKSVPHQVHSFDLVAANDCVTACDMAHVPLSRSSVDVCVFCLSLMGTNVTDFIREARRVMKKNGKMKICEIESRFESVDDFIRDVETIGFTMVNNETFSKMFIDFEFERVSRKLSGGKSLPQIHLKPCIYKRR